MPEVPIIVRLTVCIVYMCCLAVVFGKVFRVVNFPSICLFRLCPFSMAIYCLSGSGAYPRVYFLVLSYAGIRHYNVSINTIYLSSSLPIYSNSFYTFTFPPTYMSILCKKISPSKHSPLIRDKSMALSMHLPQFLQKG